MCLAYKNQVQWTVVWTCEGTWLHDQTNAGFYNVVLSFGVQKSMKSTHHLTHYEFI